MDRRERCFLGLPFFMLPRFLATRFPPPHLGLLGADRFFAEKGFVDWERDEIDPPDSPRMVECTVAGDWVRRCGMDVECSDEECAEASDFVEGVKRTFCESCATSRGEARAEAEAEEVERRLGDDMMDY
jgi:hypothetical protein